MVDLPHLLSALLREPGIPAQILERLGADAPSLEKAASEQVAGIPRVEGTSERVYAGAGLDSALRSADTEARALGDAYVSTEHLLVGIVENADGELAEETRGTGRDEGEHSKKR